MSLSSTKLKQMRLRHLILLTEAAVKSFEEWEAREINRIAKERAVQAGDTEPESINQRILTISPEIKAEYENRFQHIKDWMMARNIPIETMQQYNLERAEKKAAEWIKLMQQGQKTGKDEENKERKVVVNDDKWMVLVPSTPESASRYAGGTRWCTAAPGTAKHYMDQGPLYVIISKTEKTLQPKTGEQVPVKYQFHPATNQYMDIEDRRVKDLSKFEFLPKILIDDGSIRSFETIMTDFPDLVREFIEKNVHRPDSTYMNAALQAKNQEAYKILKEMGAPVPDNVFNYLRDDFFLPDEDMRYLIKNAPNMTSGDFAPFRYAISKNDTKLLEEIINRYEKQNAQAQVKTNLFEPATYAVKNNAVDCLRTMVSHKSWTSSSIIKIAARQERPDCVAMLLQIPKIDPAVDDNDAVKYALGMRYKKVSELLMNDKRVTGAMSPEQRQKYEAFLKLIPEPKEAKKPKAKKKVQSSPV